MTEDTSEPSDEPRKPLRGTASRPNPFAGESPPDGPDTEATVTIRDNDGSVREYELTDEVKRGYEKFVSAKFDKAEVGWYELWWDGTELFIEYEGNIRDTQLRPDHEELSREELMQMLHQGQSPKINGIPKKMDMDAAPSPQDMMQGHMPQPQVEIDLTEQIDNDLEYFDEGVIPVYNTTSIDVQKRANERPMLVEDMFIRPWESGNADDPINTEHADGEVEYEISDFRDFTDEKESTVSQGARGNRWNL